MVAGTRGFGDDVAMHDSWLADMWDRVVGPKDQVWLAGDLTMGSAATALEWVSQRPGSKHLIMGNHDQCVDSQTRAITKRGYLLIEDLVQSDELLSADKNGDSCWVRPERIISYEHSGSMIRLRGEAKFNALLTPHHRVVGKSYNCKLNKFTKWREQEAVDFGANSRFGIVFAGKGSIENAIVSDNNLRLAAWAHTDSSRTSGGWVFYQSEPKNNRIEQLLEGINFSDRARDRNITEICGKQLLKRPEISHEYTVQSADMNARLDYLVPDKNRLSPWVWTLSERQVDVLLAEWEYTDGTTPSSRKIDRTSTVIYCSREDLRHDLMTLMTANGWSVSETEYRVGHWRINAKKSTVSLIRLQRTFEEYSGVVWCVSVPTGQFFVERNGFIHLTGNCFPGHKDSHKHMKSWMQFFDSIQLHAKKKIAGKEVLFSHFPYWAYGDGPERPTARYEQWRLPDLGMPLCHGHTHGKDKSHENMLHVGVDAWGRMVSLDEIADWVRSL